MSMSRYFQRLFGLQAKDDSDPRPATVPPAPELPPAPPFDYRDPRIPDASRDRIRTILALIAEIASGAANEEIFSPVIIEIHQISDVNLPALVKSYIEIPASHRAEIFRKTGRSASYLLNDALDKLRERLNAMSLSLAQGNIDAFTSTMRFIDMRYGANDLSLD